MRTNPLSHVAWRIALAGIALSLAAASGAAAATRASGAAAPSTAAAPPEAIRCAPAETTVTPFTATAAAPAAPFIAPPAPDSSSFDVRAFRFLNGGLASPVLDAIMPFATDFDRWRTIVILIWCALVLFGKAKGRWAALMLIPVIAASDQLSSAVIKPLIERVRPCEVLGGVHLWYGPEGWITTPAEVMRSYKSSPAFPSSHAANITASMLFLGLVYRRALAPLLAVALTVSFSRIYIGVHWPSDVLGGMALGALIAWAAHAAFKRVYRREPSGAEPLTRSEPGTPPSE